MAASGGGGGSAATWKALSTLEWKKKQRKPTSVQKGVGAILGEAADVVGARGGSAGSGSSPYLNRLSEIQIQDEAYIHQQLVKPEEVKPKRSSAHRLLLVGRGSRSGRGVSLKVSVSRKVRFNSDPTAAGATADHSNSSSPTSHGRASAVSPGAMGRTSSSGSAGSAGSGGHHGPAASSKPTGRRAGGVSFAPQGSGKSSNSGNSGGNANMQAAEAQLVHGSGPSSSTSSMQATHNNTSPAQPAATGTPSDPSTRTQPAQRSPSPLPAPSPLQQHQHAGGGYSGAPSSSTGKGSKSASTSSSSAGAAAVALAVDSNTIMARFLQPQPYGLDSPAAAHANAASSNSSTPWQAEQVQAERQGSGQAAAEALLGRRRTTELVDKQLQWLRESKAPASNTASTSGSAASTAQQSGSTASAAAANPAAATSALPFDDFKASLGYRPIGIPEQLFERWTALGTAAPAAAKPSASTTAPSAGASSTAQQASSSNNSKGGGAAARRTTTDVAAGASTAGGSRQNAASPARSRPGTTGNGSDSGAGSAGPTQSSSDMPLSRRVSGTILQDAGGTRHHASTTTVTSAHLPLTRQRTADTATTTVSGTLPGSTLSSKAAAARQQLPSLSGSGGGTPCASQPPSGRASPAPGSPKGYNGSGSNSSSLSGHHGPKPVSAGAIGSAGSSSLSASALGGVAHHRRSRTTSSTASSHGDEGGWELQAGRMSPLRGGPRSTTPSASGGAQHVPQGGSGGIMMGPRRGGSGVLQDDSVSITPAKGASSVTTSGQLRAATSAAALSGIGGGGSSSRVHFPGVAEQQAGSLREQQRGAHRLGGGL